MHDRPFSLAGDLEITAVAPTSAAAVQAMRAYICDVASSYYRRPATTAEVQAALVQHPSDDLVPPTGLFLVATDGHDIVGGCVALARVDHEVGEVRRLHVAPALRGLGLGRRLMLEVEHRAREMGLTSLQLDTRRDLVESQRLYESLGFRGTAPYSGGPFSDRWYRQDLS